MEGSTLKPAILHCGRSDPLSFNTVLRDGPIMETKASGKLRDIGSGKVREGRGFGVH